MREGGKETLHFLSFLMSFSSSNSLKIYIKEGREAIIFIPWTYILWLKKKKSIKTNNQCWKVKVRKIKKKILTGKEGRMER